jgi:hypothetical protein
MNAMLFFFRKYATLKIAFITLVALQLTVAVLQNFDQPLRTLTPGESKLDFHSQYDVATVERIFGAYGPEGRRTYALDLLVDTFYPLLLGLSAIFFALLVVRQPLWQTVLILIPLLFMTADVLENIFFVSFLLTYPAISAALVSVANLFTRIKLFTIPITFLQLYGFVLLTICIFMLQGIKKWKDQRALA